MIDWNSCLQEFGPIQNIPVNCAKKEFLAKLLSYHMFFTLNCAADFLRPIRKKNPSTIFRVLSTNQPDPHYHFCHTTADFFIPIRKNSDHCVMLKSPKQKSAGSPLPLLSYNMSFTFHWTIVIHHDARARGKHDEHET